MNSASSSDSRSIPVLGLVGISRENSPSCHGGFRARGRDDEAAALLVEGVFEAAARRITETVSIPTIGIGASPHCDGQVLVTEDILGLFLDYAPKFSKK